MACNGYLISKPVVQKGGLFYRFCNPKWVLMGGGIWLNRGDGDSKCNRYRKICYVYIIHLMWWQKKKDVDYSHAQFTASVAG